MLHDIKTTPPGIPMQTVRSAARLCGVSEKTIRRRITTGELTAYRIGRGLRISDDDLLATFERVYTAPSEGEKRIAKLAAARNRQKSYRALRQVQVAEDDSAPGGANPGADMVHSDPVGNAAVYRTDDPPVVRVGSTGQHVIFDKLKREAGPDGVTDGVRELTHHNGRESEAWKREHHKAVNLD